ncbi:hypothetical protein [Microvirga ossetica]|uniref:hypothetical protein n=1 Tax=Microvirga ossetica TaxID=1882682 RepID=UPI0012FFE8C4|nr:hypothetical protein [Microvirga ossetica]
MDPDLKQKMIGSHFDVDACRWPGIEIVAPAFGAPWIMSAGSSAADRPSPSARAAMPKRAAAMIPQDAPVMRLRRRGIGQAIFPHL